MQEHYIRDGIRTVYAEKMIAPLLFLALVTFLAWKFSFTAFLTPVQIALTDTAEQYLKADIEYVTVDVEHLYYTGYTCTRRDKLVGYYYYTPINDSENYIFFLLTPEDCGDGESLLNDRTVVGRIREGESDYQVLLTAMAEELNWTYAGISEVSGAYYISEPDYGYLSSYAVLIVAGVFGVYAGLYTLACLVYILFPTVSPSVLRLSRYGKRRELFAQAETELATLPQLATEDMFITEHFFIEVSGYGVALIPISEIIWIYKHSTMRKFSPVHIKLSYTMRIYGTHRVQFDCPRNTKSDIDGIMDYLAEANHDILVGFSEENMKIARQRRKGKK